MAVLTDMQAVILDRFGDPEVLGVRTVDSPTAREGWTTIRVRAAALNWHDVLVRRGLYRSPLPHILGADAAGETLDGSPVIVNPSLFWGARSFAPAAGWEILGDSRPGTYAELVAVPSDALAPRPDGFSWAEASALSLVGMTSYRALITRAALESSESVLILGAGGGLAPAATAIARAVGAAPYVTSSSMAKIARAREHGAVDGVLYTSDDWVAHARSMSPHGEGYDVVLDAVGTWNDSLQVLRPGGRLVVLGASRAHKASLHARSFYFGQYSLLGTTMGSPADFSGLMSLVTEGRLAAPIVDSTYPLHAAAAAHRHLEGGGAYGKIVLTTV